MTVLPVVAEEEVAGTLLRWTRAPVHLHPDCSCGESDVLLCSTADAGGYWLPVGVRPPSMSREDFYEFFEVADPRFVFGTARCAAAFGVKWNELTVLMMRGQCALMTSLEDATMMLVAGIEPERLVELRRTCVWPADAVRALRLMRDHAGTG